MALLSSFSQMEDIIMSTGGVDKAQIEKFSRILLAKDKSVKSQLYSELTVDEKRLFTPWCERQLQSLRTIAEQNKRIQELEAQREALFKDYAQKLTPELEASGAFNGVKYSTTSTSRR